MSRWATNVSRAIRGAVVLMALTAANAGVGACGGAVVEDANAVRDGGGDGGGGDGASTTTTPTNPVSNPATGATASGGPPTLDDWCAMMSNSCIRMWSTGDDPRRFCDSLSTYFLEVLEWPDCRGYDVIEESAEFDTHFFFYNRQSHMLVGVSEHSDNGLPTCAGVCPPIDDRNIASCIDSAAPVALCRLDADGGRYAVEPPEAGADAHASLDAGASGEADAGSDSD